MLRAVLDTNVSPQLLAEIHEVLMRPAILDLLKKTPDEVNKFLKLLLKKTFVTEVKLEIDVLKNDPDDNMVLAAALEGQATCLVTGNTKHFPFEKYQGVKIVKPREFVAIFNNPEN